MSEDNSKNHDSSATHQRLQHSTTLNRRYVTRPEPMIQHEQAEAKSEAMVDSPSAPAIHESSETTAAVAISSFAKCQAENLRRRQELADKINKERALAMQSKSARRGYVAADTSAQQPKAPTKSIQVIAIDDDPEEDWDTEEEEIIDDDMHYSTTAPEFPASQADMPPTIELPSELPMQRAANARLAQTWPETSTVQQPTAQELKDAAIRKAMRSVATMEAAEQKSERKKQRRYERRRMRVNNRKRIALAIVCAAAVVGGIGYFVATNMPSVSYGAMAMQSGIDLSGMWVPRDFSLITSSAGEGSLSVIYAKGEDQFSLSAELSTWDSQTLLNNYVTTNWRGYDVVKEQGKTIYISGSNAAWVSGGVRYILESKSGTLTNKQIKTIAASL